MKKIFSVLNLIGIILLFFVTKLTVSASGKLFNVSSKAYFLGSLYRNLLEVNEDFRDIENPFYNPEIYKYALAIHDVVYDNNLNFENVLKNHNIQYSITNLTDTAEIFESKLQFQVSSLYPKGYTDDFERLKLVLKLSYNGNYKEWYSNLFYRYYKNSSLYGLPDSYEPTKTIQYSLDNKIFYTIRMIDNRKLTIWKTANAKEQFEIDIQTHYNRNDNNPDFVNPRLSSDDMFGKYGIMIEDPNAYFHKIGEYDGDTSNVNNVKHTSGAFEGFIFEVVYSSNKEGAKLVTSPTVMGTYNFSPPAKSEAHRIKDVIPYLIWGNAADDNTSLKERFYFDYDDYRGGTNYTKRGNSLFNAVSYGAYLSYNLDMLNDRIENPCVKNSLYY